MDPTKKITLWSRRKKDFRIDWFSGTGPGGQHKNKCMNSCRITDKETGLVGMSQEHRSREQNQKLAFKRLVEKLKEHYQMNERRQRGTNGETVRTYHEPDNRVVDHQTGMRYSYRETVGKDDLSQPIKDRQHHMLDKSMSGQ